jgi:Sulfotransferase domain
MATSQPRSPEQARDRERNLTGKTRVHELLKRRLPPAAFELAVGGYYGLRSAAGRGPGRGRVLPDFLVIGAAKCGTTSLFDWICLHPLVARPSTNGRPRKELLFFDYNFHRGADWYRMHFPLERERQEFEREHGRPFLTGEATASYLTGHWVPGRVRQVAPDVKLIVTLRNPIDRAYSAFQMSRRERLEECESFEDAIALEPERLAGELERARSDPRYNPPLPPPLGYWSYLHRSRYADHVERWLEVFPREQILFLEFEDLAADPQGALDRVHAFLGLPPYRGSELRKLNAATYTEMNPRTRTELVEHFRPYNQRLRELTGIDFRWDR